MKIDKMKLLKCFIPAIVGVAASATYLIDSNKEKKIDLLIERVDNLTAEKEED